jgi:polyhydroxybutyrate depolymerase
MNNTKHTFLIAFLFCAATIAMLNAQPEKEFRIFKYQGIERLYYFYMPNKLRKKAPLVFMMHAIGGNYNEYYNKLIEMGQRDGFAVCVPFGMPSADSNKRTGQWNCHYEYQSSDTIDDVGFVNELAKFLQKKYKLNPLNTFCTGHSTGGDFCFIMAHDPRNIFTAFAPVSGCILEDFYKSHPLPHPLPILICHGTNDPSIPWNGDPTDEKKYGNFISVWQATNYWVTANRCTNEIISQLPIRNRKIVCHRFVGGAKAFEGGPDAEVRLYEVVNGGHGWPDEDMDTYEVIWKFFKMYLR